MESSGRYLGLCMFGYLLSDRFAGAMKDTPDVHNRSQNADRNEVSGFFDLPCQPVSDCERDQKERYSVERIPQSPRELAAYQHSRSHPPGNPGYQEKDRRFESIPFKIQWIRKYISS